MARPPLTSFHFFILEVTIHFLGLGKTFLALFLASNPTISQVHLPWSKRSHQSCLCLMRRNWQLRVLKQRSQGKKRGRINKGRRVGALRDHTLLWDYTFSQRSIWRLEPTNTTLFLLFFRDRHWNHSRKNKGKLTISWGKWKCSKQTDSAIHKKAWEESK